MHATDFTRLGGISSAIELFSHFIGYSGFIQRGRPTLYQKSSGLSARYMRNAQKIRGYHERKPHNGAREMARRVRQMKIKEAKEAAYAAEINDALRKIPFFYQ